MHGVVQGHMASRKWNLQMSEVIAAWAERCSGPGWSNQVVWYLTRDSTGNLKIHDIQPGDMSDAMLHLFNTSAALHQSMVHAVGQWHKQDRSVGGH